MLTKILSFCNINKKYLFSIPRSLYYNVKLLPLNQAIKIPIFLSNNTKIQISKSCHIEIRAQKLYAGMIKIGYTQSNFFPSKHHKSVLDLGKGQIIFKGFANIGSGAKISIDKEGILIIGNQFWSTGPILIIARKLIQFGQNCVLSWNITIMDHDAHNIYNNQGNKTNIEENIVLGNKVWIGCNTTLLKGTMLSDNNIIGANSLVTKEYKKKNILLAGNPVKIRKEDITWGE